MKIPKSDDYTVTSCSFSFCIYLYTCRRMFCWFFLLSYLSFLLMLDLYLLLDLYWFVLFCRFCLFGLPCVVSNLPAFTPTLNIHIPIQVACTVTVPAMPCLAIQFALLPAWVLQFVLKCCCPVLCTVYVSLTLVHTTPLHADADILSLIHSFFYSILLSSAGLLFHFLFLVHSRIKLLSSLAGSDRYSCVGIYL